ncbi:hypothetical protein JX265_010111 [Neoarthrinium moseri]|uniref:Uncharacterized protein n=1 Tax=Neoarthrinium moseri TaxID=1658444 RepID=A0A9Q0AM11_9PEZI|nr:hypothetical protein JX265_010111 [Neoarthrinium moseri]
MARLSSIKLTLATLLAATASGASIPCPQDPTSYAVTKFFASCIPHSLTCSYQFIVDAATTCALVPVGPDYLPEVPLTGCADPRYSWAVTRTADGGLDLSITTVSVVNPGVNVTGTHKIASDELEVTNHGSVQDQSYAGPQDFAVQVAA